MSAGVLVFLIYYKGGGTWKRIAKACYPSAALMELFNDNNFHKMSLFCFLYCFCLQVFFYDLNVSC